jgi:hypothetical protein
MALMATKQRTTAGSQLTCLKLTAGTAVFSFPPPHSCLGSASAGTAGLIALGTPPLAADAETQGYVVAEIGSNS